MAYALTISNQRGYDRERKARGGRDRGNNKSQCERECPMQLIRLSSLSRSLALFISRIHTRTHALFARHKRRDHYRQRRWLRRRQRQRSRVYNSIRSCSAFSLRFGFAACGRLRVLSSTGRKKLRKIKFIFPAETIQIEPTPQNRTITELFTYSKSLIIIMICDRVQKN